MITASIVSNQNKIKRSIMLETVYNLYKEHGVVLEGHFGLSSGRHSDRYINKDVIYCNPELLEETVNSIIDVVSTNVDPLGIDIVTGPAIAGAVLAIPTAMKMWKQFVYPEKKYEIEYEDYMDHGEPHTREKIISNKIMEFRRGYDKILKGKRVLLVEDIITTGGSVKRTTDAIRLCGGTVVVVCAIWNRSGWQLDDCENLALIDTKVDSWAPEDCPQCLDGFSLIDPKSM